MSIQCDNTTPIVSKLSELTTPTGTIDLSALLAQPDPLDSPAIDRGTAIRITDGLNNQVLSTADLSNFPTLKERYGQFPLTYTEVAGYMIDNNADGFNILNSINRYDSTLGPEVVLTDALSGLDLYYATNYGKSISEGLCGSFGNTLMELFALFSLIDATTAKLANLDIKNLDPMKLATALAEKLKLEAIKDKLLETIDKLIEKIDKKVRDSIASAIDDIREFVGDPKGVLLRHVTKLGEEIDEFFSSDTVQRIRENVEAFIAEMVAMFETPTIANVQLMMQKLCNFTETIMAILFGPADEIAEVAKVAKEEQKIIDTHEKMEKKSAEEAGAIRVDKTVAEGIKEKSTKKINDAASDNDPNRYIEKEAYETRRGTKHRDVVKYRQPGDIGYVDPATNTLAIPTNVDYVTSDKITSDEIEAINKMDESGIGPNRLIRWDAKVVKDKGWQKLDNAVLAKLLRISVLTGEKYTLKQGIAPRPTRKASQEYGKIRKQGSAMYHHKYSGFAVELFVTDANRDKTIIAASRAGFTGIGVGKTYLRLNLGARDGQVAGKDDPRWPSTERFDPADTIRYTSMMKKHSIDGYRNKREIDEDFRFFNKSTHKKEENNDGTFSFVDNNSILGTTSQEETPAFSLLRPDS